MFLQINEWTAYNDFVVSVIGRENLSVQALWLSTKFFPLQLEGYVKGSCQLGSLVKPVFWIAILSPNNPGHNYVS